MIWRGCFAALLACTLPACAQDFVATTGKLSDDDFFRLVTCGAAPGGDCTVETVRWSPEDARDLTFALAAIPGDYPRPLAVELPDALDRAITAINGAGAALRLRRADKPANADVVIYPRSFAAGDRMSGLPRAEVNGIVIGAAHVHVWWGVDDRIDDALIVMGIDMTPSEVFPILLEEMTQSLGPLTDIKNPYYDRRSVFSEDSNSVTKLGPQDRMVLRRLYGS